jgi:hypothetical protein
MEGYKPLHQLPVSSGSFLPIVSIVVIGIWNQIEEQQVALLQVSMSQGR